MSSTLLTWRVETDLTLVHSSTCFRGSPVALPWRFIDRWSSTSKVGPSNCLHGLTIPVICQLGQIPTSRSESAVSTSSTTPATSMAHFQIEAHKYFSHFWNKYWKLKTYKPKLCRTPSTLKPFSTVKNLHNVSKVLKLSDFWFWNHLNTRSVPCRFNCSHESCSCSESHSNLL